MNPTRTGVIDILRAMGADIDVSPVEAGAGEPIADIRVRSSELSGIRIPTELVTSAIDEFPAIFVAAACAQGETILSGAEELRVKESDRIAVMADGLRRLGIEAKPTADGMVIQGQRDFTGGTVDSRGDHRVAMAFAMAALRAQDPLEILDCANVNTSFPGFAELAGAAGLGVEVL
jgi:3-phosphoshikimate 1-carboxyvinyltransferase